MLPGTLKELKPDLFETICSEKWDEGIDLDFKQELPKVDEPKSKFDLLKDICAFANANGGDLVYGIAEEKSTGTADKPTPINPQQFPISATTLRLQQIIHSGIEPPVSVEFQPVSKSDTEYFLVVRVHPSFQKPHRYKINDNSRWVVRVNKQAVDMTYQQIRNEFDRNATLMEQAKTFRRERTSAFTAGLTDKPLKEGARCLVHLIPLAAFTGSINLDVASLDFYQFGFPNWRGISRKLNLEGLLVDNGDYRESLHYTQIFRNGIFEAASHFEQPGKEANQSEVHIGVVSAFIRDALQKFLNAAKQWEIAGPAVYCVSLLDTQGKTVVARIGYRDWSEVSQRQGYLLPETYIDNLANIPSLDELAKPLLDMFWQCFNHQKCVYYNNKNEWDMK